MKEPIVDRAFADKFLTAVDRPFDYGVYFLFHDWWAEAPAEAIDAYHQELLAVPGADDFLAERHLPEPVTLGRLADCAPGTLGHAYRAFIVDNGLAPNLARDYRTFNEELQAAGTLDRLPEDLRYTIVRGFQIHDVCHVLTASKPDPLGELRMAAFHWAQLRFPYHAMRMAVTFGHLAFVNPGASAAVMDAITDGWQIGRAAQNLHFEKWEAEFDTPIDDLRARYSIATAAA